MDRSAGRIDKASPVPLYYQLAELLREEIRSGTLAPGDRLPSERELGERTGISRMTARQAISYLVRSGDLVVRPGIGTFVAEPKLAYDALHLLGFSEETMRRGGDVHSHVLEQAVVEPPASVAAQLEIAPGETATRVTRLRSSGETPLLLETSTIPTALCPGLDEADLATHSLYALIELRYNLRLATARQTLEATVANEYEAGLFGVPRGTAMLLLEGVAYERGGEPVEHFKALYRGDRLKLELRSRRDGAPDDPAAAARVSLRMGA